MDSAVAISVHAPYLPYLPDAIASIEAQTVVPAEKWLLCDGCEPPADLPPGWRVVRGNWHCVSGGRNEAIRQTASGWLTWLDADDAFAPGHLAWVQAEIGAAASAVGFLYPDLDYYTADWSARCGQMRFRDWDRDALRSGNFVPTPSTWRVQMLRDMGGWPAGVPQMDDWCTAMRGSRLGWTGRHVDGSPVRVRKHGANVSNCGDTRPAVHWASRRLSIVTLFSGIEELLPQWADWVACADLPPQTTVIAGDNGQGPEFTARLRAALAALPARQCLYVPVANGIDLEPGVNAAHSRVPGLYNQAMPQACDLGDFVLMLEDDVLPPLDAVRVLAACFQTGHRTPPLAGVAGLYESRGGHGALCVSRDPWVWRSNFTTADVRPGLQPIGQIPGGCSLFDSRALRLALPFRWTVDPGGARVGWDGNMSRTLNRAGYQLCYHGGVRCEHHVSTRRYSGGHTITRLPAPRTPHDGRDAVRRHPVVRLGRQQTETGHGSRIRNAGNGGPNEPRGTVTE